MKTQPRLNCHYKFISAKNIIFVSSDGTSNYIVYVLYVCFLI